MTSCQHEHDVIAATFPKEKKTQAKAMIEGAVFYGPTPCQSVPYPKTLERHKILDSAWYRAKTVPPWPRMNA
jgi:hypothetical protein